jgi:hypothetical protein
MSYLTNGRAVVIGNGSAVVDDCELVSAKPVFEPPTLAQRIQTAIGDYRKDRAALQRVLNLANGHNILPMALVERKVSERIERDLVEHVGSIVGAKLRDMQRVEPA